jgi:MFS family permease
VSPASLRPLRSRNYALVWSAALVSNVGTWMQTVALGFVITRNTSNALWTGVIAAAAFIPIGLLSPVGGALADRFDHRRWLVVTTLAEAAFATALALAAGSGHEQPWLLTTIAFAGGCAAAIGFPTYQAMLPQLVPRDDLLAAVTLSSAQFNVGRVIGPALAGVVLVAGGATWTFAANALSFGAVVVALALIRLPARRPAGPGPGLVARMVDGARLAWAEPGCRSAVLLIAIVAFIGSPFIALVPAMAVKALHAGARGNSALVTAQGVGAVLGALALPALAMRRGQGPTVRLALAAFPVALGAYGAISGLWPDVAAIAVVGCCYIGVLSGLNTVVQVRAPAEARGRVLGIYMMALGAIYPVGAVVQGALEQAVGVRVVTVGAGILLLAVLAVVAATRWPWMAALDNPAAAPPAEVAPSEAAPPAEVAPSEAPPVAGAVPSETPPAAGGVVAAGSEG